MKKGMIIGIIVAVLVLAGAGVGGYYGWYYGIKVPHDQAYQAYQEKVQACDNAVQSYNDAINQYNNRAKEIIAANNAFDEAISAAQALVDCGDTPYEGAKITNLSNSIKDARNNKAGTPEFKEIITAIQADPAIEKQKKTEIDAASAALDTQITDLTNRTAAVNSERDALVIPDYTAYVENMAALSKELEDSYAVQRQITAPTEEWVLTRLGRVSDVANMAPVTEEHDPNGRLNKQGGYTSTVYFGSPLLGTEELTGDALIEEGTDAGGAIETYRTVEDAESRDSYLGALDGGIFTSGSHKVLGTMVIRTSDSLKASQQETLTNAIVAAMLALE